MVHLNSRDQVYQRNYYDACIPYNQRHALNAQVTLSFKEFLSQQLDQIFQYNQI